MVAADLNDKKPADKPAAATDQHPPKDKPVTPPITTAEQRTTTAKETDRVATSGGQHLTSVEIHGSDGSVVTVDGAGKPTKVADNGKTYTTLDGGKTFTSGNEHKVLVKGKDGLYSLVDEPKPIASATAAAPADKGVAPGAPAAAPADKPVDQTQALKDAIAIHKAADADYSLFRWADQDGINKILQGKTDAERKAIGDQYKTKYGVGLEDEVKKFESGATLDTFENIYKRQDNNGNNQNASRIHEDLLEMKSWGGRSQSQLEKDVRDTLSTHTPEQLQAMDQQYKSMYGISLKDAIAKDPKTSQVTKDMAGVYLSGPHDDAATAKLINISLKAGNADCFQEAMRDASDAARKSFMDNGGAQKTQDALGQGILGKAMDFALGPIVGGLVDHAYNEKVEHALDYAKGGKLDAATQVADNTGFVFNNTDGVQLALKRMTDDERNQYFTGKSVDSKTTGLTADETKAKAYYENLHGALGKISNDTDMVKYEDMIANHGESSFVGGLAKDRGFFTNSSAADIGKQISGMSQSDWTDLKAHPERRAAFQDMLKSLGKSTTEISDLTKQYDAKLSPDSFDKASPPKSLPEQLDALDRHSTGGGRFSRPTIAADEKETVRLVEKAFHDDPKLQDRVLHPTTDDDKKLAAAFQTSLKSALGIHNDDYNQIMQSGHVPLEKIMSWNQGTFGIGNDEAQAYKDIVNATPEERARLQNDPVYKDKLLGFMSADRQQIAEAVAKNGTINPEDNIRNAIVGWGGSSTIIADLQGVKAEDLDTVRANYLAKYGTSFDGDVMAKLSGTDRNVAEQILAKNLSAETQVNIAKTVTESTRSGVGAWMSDNVFRSGTGAQADDTLNQSNHLLAEKNNLQQAIASGTDMASRLTPEQQIAAQQAVQQQLAAALSFQEDATKNHIASKQKAGEYVGDAAIATVAVGSMILSGGLSTPLVVGLAAAGATLKVGTNAMMEGNDYDWSVGHVATDGTIGAVMAATSVIGPGQIAAVFGIGESAAKESAVLTLSSLADAGLSNTLKEGGAELLENGTKSIIRNTLSTAATKLDQAAFNKLAESAVSAEITGEARQQAVALISSQLQANVAERMATGVVRLAAAEALNAGGGALGGGVSGFAQGAVQWDSTKTVSENLALIAKSTEQAALTGALAGGVTTSAVVAGRNVVQSLRAGIKGPVPEVAPEVGPPVLPDAPRPVDVTPVVEPRPDVPTVETVPVKAPPVEVKAPAVESAPAAVEPAPVAVEPRPVSSEPGIRSADATPSEAAPGARTVETTDSPSAVPDKPNGAPPETAPRQVEGVEPVALKPAAPPPEAVAPAAIDSPKFQVTGDNGTAVAQQLDKPTVIEGVGTAKKGDWLVTTASGETQLVVSENFNKLFKAIDKPVTSPTFEFNKTATVKAEVSQTPFEWKDWKGNTMHANAGDLRVTQPDGSISSVKPDIFNSTYSEVPGKPGEFAKTAITKAQQLESDTAVNTLEGIGTGKKGDWLVTGPQGEQYIVTGDKFNQLYKAVEKPVDTPSFQFQKQGTVKAEVSNQPFDWTDWKGNKMHAEAGDLKVTQPDGSTSSIKKDIFDQTYSAVPGKPGEFAKSAITNAQQLEGDTVVNTLEGLGTGKKGDWLVTGPQGEKYIISGDKFNKLYKGVETPVETPSFEFQKQGTVKAEVSQTPFDWKDYKGNAMHAEAGDLKVTQPDGSISSIKKDIFDQTYSAVPGKPGEFAKTAITKAQQLEGDTVVNTLEGVGTGKKGDWLVTGPQGEKYIISGDKFNKLYKGVETPVETPTFEFQKQGTVKAEVSQTPFDWKDYKGNAMHAEAGDLKVTQPDGSISSIKKDIFDQTYSPVPGKPGEFAKTAITKAQQLEGDTVVNTLEGVGTGKKGDWMVTGPQGEKYIISGDKFNKLYKGVETPVETPTFEFRKQGTVKAEVSQTPFDWKDYKGNAMHAEAGDLKVTQPDGSISSIKKDIFDQTYSPVPGKPGEFAKTAITKAQQLEGDTVVNTLEGVGTGKKGDWMVTGPQGEKYIISGDKFNKLYKGVETPVQTPTFEFQKQGTVKAEVSQTPFDWKDYKGNAMHAEAGDLKVTQPDGSISSIKKDIFDQTYSPVPGKPGEFAKTAITKAQQLEGDTVVNTLEGVGTGKKGDWLVTGPQGEKYIISGDKFNKLYKGVETPVQTPTFEFQKQGTVKAEVSQTPFDWKDYKGNAMHAEAGDLKVTQPDGSISSIKKDIFDQTYSPVPGKPGEFAKTAITKAQQLEGDTVVNTLEGVGTGKKGDWMVTGPQGEKYIISGDKFTKLYKGVETPVQTPTFEFQKQGTVKAEVSQTPFDWKDYKGNAMHAEAGDLKVTQPDGSISSIKKDIFDQTYSPVPGKPGEFAKTAITKAQQLEGDTVVNTLEGVGTGKKGDWMVTGPQGEKYIISGDKFNKLYKGVETPVETPTFEFQKQGTVKAEVSQTPFDWKDYKGNAMHAEAGDLKVTQPDGSISSIKKDIFDQTYSPVPGKPGEFAKTAITKAQQLEGDTVVNTLEGVGTGKKGDWLVTGPQGEKYIISGDKFNKLYKGVETPVQTPTFEFQKQGTVKAEVSQTPFDWKDYKGNAMHAEAGDLKVTQPDGSISSIKKDIFDQTYSPVPGKPGEFAKTAITKAQQLEGDTVVNTLEGVGTGKKGDWLVTGPQGEKYIISGDKFNKLYKGVETPVQTPTFEFQKQGTVKAEVSQTPFDWKDYKGNAMHAEAGDLKVTQPDGSISSIKKDIFDQTYSPVPGKPGEFAKTAITKAQQLEGDTVVNTLEGVGTGKKGDWMVTGPQGEKYIISGDKFNKLYKGVETPVQTPTFEFQKQGTVKAEVSQTPFDWKDYKGNAMHAEAGDLKVTQPDGSISSIKKDIFDQTYSPVPGKPGEFAKTAITKAQQLEGDTVVNTLEGVGTGKKGDWMVTGPQGEKYIISGDKFNKLYKGVETPVETPTFEFQKQGTVKAEVSQTPFDWKDYKGNAMHAEAGDLKVTQPDGSISSIKKDIFDQTYSPVPGKPGEFAKTAITKAQQLEGDTVVNTLEGVGTGKKGDWLVTGPQGEKYIISGDKFNKLYKGVETPVNTPTLEFQKQGTVKAEVSPTPFDWKDYKGNAMHAEAGDLKVTQPDGSISSIKKDIFDQTYSPVPGKPGEFAKTAITKAQQLEGDTVVNTLEGVGTGKKGDWLVTGPQGEKYIINGDKFNQLYKAVDKATTAAPKPATFEFKPTNGQGANVVAEQVSADGNIAGIGAAKKGDWIVTGANGEKQIMPREAFESNYSPRPLEVPSEPQEYVKSMTIQAKIITEPTEWHNPDAAPGTPAQIAQPGDYMAYPNGQEPYVIPGDYFKKNYVPLPGLNEYGRTGVTSAQVLTDDAQIWSKNSGVTKGQAGDYLITRPNGNQEILSKAKFEAQFALATAEPSAREPLSIPKATGAEFTRGTQRVTPWANGEIIRDGNSVTVTDASKQLNRTYVEGRLVKEVQTVPSEAGDKVITRTYPYGDVEQVRTLPSLQSYNDALVQNPRLARAQELSDSTPSTHEINTPERNALRTEIGQSEWERVNAKYQPAQGKTLHVVLGLSGSGKSTVAEEIAKKAHGMVLDADDVKPLFKDDWQGGIGAASLAREANEIEAPMIAKAMERGDNIVIPAVGSGTTYIEAMIEKAHSMGYSVDLTLVDIPPTEAMKRIVGRLEGGGMYVDPRYLASLGNRPAQNFTDLVNKYFTDPANPVISSYQRINNLNKPTLVESGRIANDPHYNGLDDSFFTDAKIQTPDAKK